MSKFKEYIDQLSPSKAIFKLKLSNDRDYIQFELTPHSHLDEAKVAQDPMLQLVLDNYAEHFNAHTGEYTVRRDEIADSCMRAIRSRIIRFLEKNIPLKNPKQSKLYRWAYRNMPRTYEFDDTLFLIYKYIVTHADSNMTISNTNQVHLDNALALLEAAKEKYGEAYR